MSEIDVRYQEMVQFTSTSQRTLPIAAASLLVTSWLKGIWHKLSQHALILLKLSVFSNIISIKDLEIILKC